MIWLVLLVAVVLVVLTAAAVLGRVDGSLGDTTTSLSHEPLPDRPLTPRDVDELRFDTGIRGYRMSEVDGVLDRLRREIGHLNDELAALRSASVGTPAAPLAQARHVDGAEPAHEARPVPDPR